MINGHTGPITRIGWQRWNRQNSGVKLPNQKRKFTTVTPLKPQAQAKSGSENLNQTFKNTISPQEIFAQATHEFTKYTKLIKNGFQSHQIKWPTTGFMKAKNKLDSHARNKSQQFLKLQSRIRIWIGSGVKSWKSQQANFWRKIIDRQLIQE